MNLTLRPGTENDIKTCGDICYTAFCDISRQHNFPPDFPSVEVPTGLIAWIISRPDVYSVVAEIDGKLVGSNFLWESDTIAGIGPITVDPTIQDSGIGRRLMENVMERAAQKNFTGVRLVQVAFNSRSLSLYTKLGFEVREPLACMQGAPLMKEIPGFPVRPATVADLEACNRLCWKIHGHDRKNELLGAIHQNAASVVERNGVITGYTTGIGFFTHTLAESNADLIALIAAAREIAGPGLLLPTRNGEVFRWCLANGLRVTQPLTLMSYGLYNEPRGAFMPSILF